MCVAIKIHQMAGSAEAKTSIFEPGAIIGYDPRPKESLLVLRRDEQKFGVARHPQHELVRDRDGKLPDGRAHISLPGIIWPRTKSSTSRNRTGNSAKIPMPPAVPRARWQISRAPARV